MFMLLGNVYQRVKKPFNPLKGETYEIVSDDFKCLIEQVSHHPPISCIHAECEDFEYSGYEDFKIGLSWTGLVLKPTGKKILKLKKTGEIFEFFFP